MPTAEASQLAYRALGVELYSSAAFAFAPDVSLAFHRAVEEGDQKRIDALQRTFFHPLVRLRERVSGVRGRAGEGRVTLEGLAAGPVRPPLTPSPRPRPKSWRPSSPRHAPYSPP
ncbi:hypothetical protein LV779_36585 [Streptomyces thinghirensis]|nr:hypothetical protein [Streptomyces thinghirensis]